MGYSAMLYSGGRWTDGGRDGWWTDGGRMVDRWWTDGGQMDEHHTVLTRVDG